jgi:hypothetical protein
MLQTAVRVGSKISDGINITENGGRGAGKAWRRGSYAFSNVLRRFTALGAHHRKHRTDYAFSA